MPGGQPEWSQGGEQPSSRAAAGAALMSVGAASLRLMAGTISAGYSSISAAASSAAGEMMTPSDKKEKIIWAKFETLNSAQYAGESNADSSRAVLLLGYQFGYQVWDVQESISVSELLSVRDTPIRCVQPLPAPEEKDPASSPLHNSRPLLAVVPNDVHSRKCQMVVELYSLAQHAVAHVLKFHNQIRGVWASERVLVVLLDSQLCAFNANTMESIFTSMTYPAPGGSSLAAHESFMLPCPLALGQRWLAFASNQAAQQAVGQAAQHSLGDGRHSAGYKDYMKSMATHAATSSGKQLKAGLNWMGDTGYKLLSSQYNSWMRKNEGGEGDAAAMEHQLGKSPEHGFGEHMNSQVAGTVVVRDVMQRRTIAHFRAHTSPLSLLSWDPSGLLLVTASVYGHSINVFQVSPAGDLVRGAVHLFKLSRGLTPALITSACFSSNSEWLAASSGRGTTHIFHLGSVTATSGPHLAGMARVGKGAGPMVPIVQHMGPAGRLRSAQGWATRVPGAPLAAAAAGLYAGGPGTAGPSVGAIAAQFMLTKRSAAEGSDLHNGLQYSETHAMHSVINEELLICGPDGVLTHHRLWLGPEGGSQVGDEDSMFGTSPGSISSFSADGDSTCGDSELGSEATARLDVCRRPTWPEREDLSRPANPPTKPTAATTDASSFPRASRSEAERHQFISHAEIGMQSARPPLWATAPQFHFLEMRPQATGAGPTAAIACDVQGLAQNSVRTLALVEELPTRRVDVARGELLPSGGHWTADHSPMPPEGPHHKKPGSASSSQRTGPTEEEDVFGCAAQVQAFEL